MVLGEATAKILHRVNRAHISKLDHDLRDKFELSMDAKISGDDDSYHHLNREANDAFGKVFFNMFTLSAAMLWSVFIALAWMQTRFMNIEFPLPLKLPVLGGSVGYVFTFLLFYIIARIFMSNIKRLTVRVV